MTNPHLVQSDPVPGAASKVGRNSESGRCIGDTVPLVLHHDRDERNVHLVRKLHKTQKSHLFLSHLHLRANRVAVRTSHLQGEDGGHGFVVTDGVLHVTPVAVLHHLGAAGQP